MKPEHKKKNTTSGFDKTTAQKREHFITIQQKHRTKNRTKHQGATKPEHKKSEHIIRIQQDHRSKKGNTRSQNNKNTAQKTNTASGYKTTAQKKQTQHHEITRTPHKEQSIIKQSQI
jgi:hypothetical protein